MGQEPRIRPRTKRQATEDYLSRIGSHFKIYHIRKCAQLQEQIKVYFAPEDPNSTNTQAAKYMRRERENTPEERLPSLGPTYPA